MNKDILLWSNIEIINALDKWGVLTLRNLQKQICSNISINGLRRKIHKLANDGYVQVSRLDSKNEIIVIPTKKTLDQLKSKRSFVDEDMIYHNLFISMLGTEFINHGNVFYFKLPHEFQSSRVPSAFRSNDITSDGISPDAFLGVTHNEKLYKVALEVELTQKSSDRIYEKFNKYKDSDFFDYVIYFFKSKSILNAYRTRLNELLLSVNRDTDHKKLRSKILFLYSDQKHQYGTFLSKATMECADKEISIEKFFGNEISILNLNNNTINQ